MGSLKNQILISMPHMNDLFFSKSVVYICEHNNKGAMGLIINKKFESPEWNQIFEKVLLLDKSLKLIKTNLFLGGPVLIENGIILHHSNYNSNKSLFVSDSICITSKKEVFDDLQKTNDIPYKVMLGHSGWSPGQLEKEIKNGDWLLQNITSDFLFNIDSNQMWKQAASSLGIDLESSLGLSGQA
tara:strand:+ start:376 stop:930 length:555 start_codon:yes stop_codon:yes gene_type:complete